MPDIPDAQTLNRAAAGDKDAFAVLVDLYAAPIYGVCFSYLGNQADAQDCTQEAFLKAFCMIGDFRQSATFYTWLYRIAANCCLDLLRRNRRQSSRSLDEPLETPDGELYLQLVDQDPLPDEALDRKETIDLVREAIAELPEKMRRILILRDIEDMSYEDIARLEGLRPGTVKSRLFRARLLLAERLTQREAAAARLENGKAAMAGNNRPPAASKEQQ